MAEETKKTKKTGLSRFRKSKKVEESKEEVAVKAAPVEEKTSPKVRAVVEKPKAKKVAAPKPEPKVEKVDIASEIRKAISQQDRTLSGRDLKWLTDIAMKSGERGLNDVGFNHVWAVVQHLLK